MKRRDIIISAGLAAVILLPGAAQPQVLQKLWDTFKPPPFRIGELPAAEPATAPGETGAPAAPSAPPVAPSEPGSGWIALDPENLWVIETTKGVIIAELSPQIAPAYVARVKQLTRAGFYDGRKFFRVIDEFMAQTGDPQENGEGGSAMPDLKGEFSFKRTIATPFSAVATKDGHTGFIGTVPVRSQPDAQMMFTADGSVPANGMFCQGVLGMARAEEPDTANSQFFLMRQPYPSLNDKYTVFGRVVIGLDIVRAIKEGEPPTEPMDRMTRVRVMSDIPAEQRTRFLVMDTNAQPFRAYAENWRAGQGAAADICKLNIPVALQ